MNLNWIYTGISWILLRWHDLWGNVLHLPTGLSWFLSIVFLVLFILTMIINALAQLLIIVTTKKGSAKG